MGSMKHGTNSEHILPIDTAGRLLGIRGQVPVTHEAMAKSLRITFFPYAHSTPRIEAFAQRLNTALRDSGVEVLPFERTRTVGKRGKVEEGVVIIAPGTLDDGALPVDFVSNLRSTSVVGIEEGPCPADGLSGQQDRLNAVVETLTWNIVQVVIYVEEEKWTICTMNGAIIPCRVGEGFEEDVFRTLVPKLAAPVVPPHASDFEVEENGIDLHSAALEPYVKDFERSASLWAETRLMLFHTALDTLRFRNVYYKRVASAYLDKRSGMSYGFLSRQPAAVIAPALRETDCTDPTEWARVKENREGTIAGVDVVGVEVAGELFAVKVPEVTMLATRSGCDKSHIDGYRDIVLLGMRREGVFMKTPLGLNAQIDARPSYDTLTILAHAMANTIIASIQKRLDPSATFLRQLETDGLALAHWHGTVDAAIVPKSYVVFGEENPPVSCSTHQAAIYTLVGKVNAFVRRVESGLAYDGDVHIEPHHGINVTWASLTGLAATILSHSASRVGEDRQSATA